MEPDDKDVVIGRFSETLSAVVLGSVLTGAAQGVLGGIAYWALGVPFAVLLAGATGVPLAAAVRRSVGLDRRGDLLPHRARLLARGDHGRLGRRW